MGSAFHQLCPRYSGTLTPLPLRLLGYGTPLPFLGNFHADQMFRTTTEAEGRVGFSKTCLSRPSLIVLRRYFCVVPQCVMYKTISVINIIIYMCLQHSNVFRI